jgi:hypothetical protein
MSIVVSKYADKISARTVTCNETFMRIPMKESDAKIYVTSPTLRDLRDLRAVDQGCCDHQGEPANVSELSHGEGYVVQPRLTDRSPSLGWDVIAGCCGLSNSRSVRVRGRAPPRRPGGNSQLREEYNVRVRNKRVRYLRIRTISASPDRKLEIQPGLGFHCN